MITVTVVREGEWNEAICYKSDKHPHIEIAAQRCASKAIESWNVFYVSSRTSFTMKSFSGYAREAANAVARRAAENCLEKANPRLWIDKHFS